MYHQECVGVYMCEADSTLEVSYLPFGSMCVYVCMWGNTGVSKR